MNRLLPFHFAAKTLLLLFALLVVFHLFVLLGIVPHDIVWAGRIQSRAELIRMESISILILGIVAAIVAHKAGYLSIIKHPTVISVGMWLVVALFILNTLGNLTAVNPIEKYGFGLLTLVMAMLSLRITIGKR